MPAKLPPALLALSPGTLVDGAAADAFLQQAKELIREGLRGVLLREPNLGDADLLWLARELKGALANTQDETAWLGVHDCLHVALAAGADGAHLGFRSLDVKSARRVLGPDVCLGVSTHQGDAPAKWDGADYVFHSPVFSTPSKEGLLDPIGPGELFAFAELLEEAGAPRLFGLGGITPKNCAEVLGKDGEGLPLGVAVRGALFESDNARSNLAELLAVLRTHQVSDNQTESTG
jgi:thiamine-phosphate diphosphorylase